MKILSIRHAALPALLLPLIAAAQTTDEQTMVMIATPATVSELDIPAAVSIVDGDEMRQAAPRVNLSESLGTIPDLQVRNRRDYAQDLQLSIRRFGSRPIYSIHRLRICVNGIPATIPNGQGQASNIGIGSANTIEMLRDPFSALCGNSSGGMINVTSQAGIQPPTMETSSYYGSFGIWHYGMRAIGTIGDDNHAGDVDYTVSVNHFTTHGYRDYSGACKNLANA